MVYKPFFIWYKNVWKRIDPMKVTCLITVENYTKIYLSDKTVYMIRCSLVAAMRKLPREIFLRLDRSAIVSIYHIDEIDKEHLLIGGSSIPIARKVFNSFIKKLNTIE